MKPHQKKSERNKDIEEEACIYKYKYTSGLRRLIGMRVIVRRRVIEAGRWDRLREADGRRREVGDALEGAVLRRRIRLVGLAGKAFRSVIFVFVAHLLSNLDGCEV